jgi:hypothetical protein
VYLAHDYLSGQNVVIKLQPRDRKYHTLEHEFDVYEKLGGETGLARVRWFGIEAGFNAMAIDRLSPSLKDLFVQCHFWFTVKTTLLLAGQLVSALDLKAITRG